MDEPKENLKLFENIKHHEGKKLLILTIIIGITIVLFIVKYFIFPFFFGMNKDDGFSKLMKVIKTHFRDVSSYKINILLFILLIALVSTLMSFKNLNYKHFGIILVIAYITSIAVEARLYLTGAMLNAVIIYIYLIILVHIEKKEVDKKK